MFSCNAQKGTDWVSVGMRHWLKHLDPWIHLGGGGESDEFRQGVDPKKLYTLAGPVLQRTSWVFGSNCNLKAHTFQQFKFAFKKKQNLPK